MCLPRGGPLRRLGSILKASQASGNSSLGIPAGRPQRPPVRRTPGTGTARLWLRSGIQARGGTCPAPRTRGTARSIRRRPWRRCTRQAEGLRRGSERPCFTPSVASEKAPGQPAGQALFCPAPHPPAGQAFWALSRILSRVSRRNGTRILADTNGFRGARPAVAPQGVPTVWACPAVPCI